MAPTGRDFKRAVANLPIYGALWDVRPDSRKDAAKELSAATVFSLFPIWLYPAILLLFNKPFWETARSCVESGELYLYSAALLGPLIYSVSKPYAANDDGASDSSQSNGDANGGVVADSPESNGGAYDGERTDGPEQRGLHRVVSFRFPYEGLFSIIALLVCAIAACVFAVVRASEDGLFAPDLDQDIMLVASVLLYCFTWSCMFCVLAYRHDLEATTAKFEDGTRELTQQWHDRS